MMTTDMSLRFDPHIMRFTKTRSVATHSPGRFKLTHRDMGPIARYLGPLAPKETVVWRTRVPGLDIR